MEIRQTTYTLNDITLHVAEAGGKADQVVLFLHGFPEGGYAWRRQLLYFAAKGYRAVAPDQRGYNLSSKPQGVKAYTMEHLAADVAALIRQLTQDKVYLVGHDWGGVVAWAVAQQYPDLLEKLVILNIPHPQVISAQLHSNPRQMLRSWYAGFFQLPWLPERVCRAFNYKLMERSMVISARKNTFSPNDMACYKKVWQQPHALTSMINWYRAYKYSKLRVTGEIRVPTLLLWGEQDTFLGSEMAQPSIARCRHGQLRFLPGATHWLHHEVPDEVNRLLEAFISPGGNDTGVQG
ncbi:alpha/beta fold hydrolase [Pontibacter liquoris]|uniref:alpha/beta fold hydrolase n=1 Tax=Pontibacter liquoris TaxID=2905677 RepID=UPI001FA74921|nr:alpha/beta hydrolase [Pontibacter liquoris]